MNSEDLTEEDNIETTKKTTMKKSTKKQIKDDTDNETDDETIKMKKCSECNIEKPIDEYRVKYTFCKECLNAKQRARNALAKTKKQEKGTKTCSKCNVEKDNSEFRINRAQCHDCEKSYGRAYNKENYEKRRQWVLNNQEKMVQLQKNWYEKNKEEIRANFNERYHNDEHFRINKTLKTRTTELFNKIKFHNDISEEENIEYKEWFNFIFTGDMTWENYSTNWVIDHVIPPMFFNLNNENEVDLCYSWLNIQPLSRGENRIKSNNFDLNYIVPHLEKLNKYIEENELEYSLLCYENICDRVIDIVKNSNKQIKTKKSKSSIIYKDEYNNDIKIFPNLFKHLFKDYPSKKSNMSKYFSEVGYNGENVNNEIYCDALSKVIQKNPTLFKKIVKNEDNDNIITNFPNKFKHLF